MYYTVCGKTNDTSENVYNNNSDIEHYNQILVPKLCEMGVMINDLHAAVAADVYRYIGEDTIHLTEDGICLCAHQVADIIKEAAKTLAVAAEGEIPSRASRMPR